MHNRCRVDEFYWFCLFDMTTSASIETTIVKIISQNILYGQCNMEKQSGSLHLIKLQPETWSEHRLGASLAGHLCSGCSWMMPFWDGAYPTSTSVTTPIARFMGPTWGRQDPDGPHVGPMNFAIGAVSSDSHRLNGQTDTQLESWGFP